MSDLLPIARRTGASRRRRRSSRGRHRAGARGVVGLHARGRCAGLAGPPLLGDARPVGRAGHDDARTSTRSCWCSPASSSLQTVLTFFARRQSFVLSEKMFAELREDFMLRVLALPLSTVERAGTGDLVSRTTADVDALARTVRFALPETLIAAVTTLLTVGAAIWVSPLAALPCIAGVPALVVGTRWYLRRAPAGICGSARRTPRSPAPSARPSRAAARSRRSGLNEHRVRRLDADLARRVPRRAAHALPAHRLVPERRVRLRPAGGRALAWGGWLVSTGMRASAR